MGQFSAEKPVPPGSTLRGNQQATTALIASASAGVCLYGSFASLFESPAVSAAFSVIRFPLGVPSLWAFEGRSIATNATPIIFRS
jgi:hypothetical protein